MKQTLLFLFILFNSLCNAYAQETIQHYLSGKDKDHTVMWDFFITKGRNHSKWSTIPVPSNWECQGFGEYTYGRGDEKIDEQGLYKHTFKASATWKNKNVFIVFEGAMADTEVMINGKLAGPIHQGGFYQFRYNVSALIKYGADNLLEVKVKKVSANESVAKAECNGDFWCMGGIFRPVYLEIKPTAFIDRIAIDAKANGDFTMDVFTGNVVSGQRIETQIQTLSGENSSSSFFLKAIAKQEKVTLSTNVISPALWNPETPNLYQVLVSITDSKGVVHSMKQRFGFRTVEVRPRDGIYINGTRVIFKGVNRHSFWPESGRTLSKALSLLDVTLMKEMNMNAVRMSHYPPDQHFLDVCDSVGLFVLNELTGWQAKYDTEAGRKLVKELIVRDVNHPSVVLWANGNEGGWNTALDDDFAKHDIQKRLVYHPWEKFRGTNTKHYPDFNSVANAALYENEIYFPTEFMHGLYDGGHGAGLDDFWNLMITHPNGAGGFLWSFADEGVTRTDKNNVMDTHSNNAPDGIVGPYREKEGSFYTIKEIWSPLYISNQFIPASFNGKLSIENRYLYTNVDQCSFEWKLVSLPSPNEQTVEEKVIFKGKASSIPLAPGERGFLNLNLPVSWKERDALYLTAFDPQHREIFTWSWPIKTPVEIFNRLYPTSSKSSTQFKEDEKELVVTCDGIHYYFDKLTGYLQKVLTSKSEVSLSNGPVVTGMEHKLKQFHHRQEGEQYIVQPVYEGESSFTVKWIFTSGKPVKLEYQYTQKGESNFMGISFNYPEEKITGMKWLGQGPYRVWKNRLKGQQFGVWNKTYNNTITGESWEYPEFKGYHASLYWVKVQSKESSFTVFTENDGTFLQMLKPVNPKGAYNNFTSPTFPNGDISFLQAISPIGTKFQDAKVMGPQSQANVMTNYTPISGSLWFDFRVEPN